MMSLWLHFFCFYKMYQKQTVTANISEQSNSGSLSKWENNHFRPVIPDATKLHATHQLQRFAWHEQPPLQLVHVDWICCVFLCVKVQRVRQNKLAWLAESKEHMPGRYRERKRRGEIYIIYIICIIINITKLMYSYELYL